MIFSSGNRQIMRGGTVNRIVPPGSSMPSSSSTQGRFRIEGAPTSSSSDNRFFATNRSSTVPGYFYSEFFKKLSQTSYKASSWYKHVGKS